MADEHHDDHGNTVAAWFLTISWTVVWAGAGTGIVLGGDLVLLTVIGLGASVVCAVIAGLMKRAGLGRKEPRPFPLTREEWEAQRTPAESSEPAQAAPASTEGEAGKESANTPA